MPVRERSSVTDISIPPSGFEKDFPRRNIPAVYAAAHRLCHAQAVDGLTMFSTPILLRLSLRSMTRQRWPVFDADAGAMALHR